MPFIKISNDYAQLHRLSFPVIGLIGDTRPVLQASFKLPNGATLTGFSVHFPAPYHPTKMREAAYKTLNALVAALPQDQAVFAAGDFNTTREENIERRMLARWVRPAWEVAHDLCQGCAGTSYYPPKNDWSFLDMVLWRAARLENDEELTRNPGTRFQSLCFCPLIGRI